MRRIYRKPYNPPQYGKKQRNKDTKSSSPLVQPDWDDTIHDLTTLKASPDDVLRRKLSRTSHNQMGMTLLAQCRRSAQSGQQERYTPSASQGGDSDNESDGSYEQSQQQQQQQSPGSDNQPLTAQQLHRHRQQQQEQQRSQHTPASASVLAQYACSTGDSEDDVCQWQSPMRPTAQQLQQQAQQQQRQILQGNSNSAQHNASAVRHHKHSSWQQQQQQGQSAGQARAGTLTVEADTLQVLLDKINLLEEQLRDKEGQQQLNQQQQQPQRSQGLQQQLTESQQQLALTQQQLHQLQEEHRQYVAHSSTLLTQLQTQVQQLLTGYHTLPPLPSLRPHQRQQQQPSLPDFSSRLRPAPAPAAEREYAGTGGGGGLSGDSSSTDRLLQISSYIQQQLQEQEAAGLASQCRSTSSAAQRPFAAASVSGGSAGMGSPNRAAASGRLAGSATTASACSSPSRRKAALQFTPAVADTVALPSYAAMRQQSRAGAAAAAGSPVRRWQPGCTTAAAISPRGAGGAGAAAGTAEVRGGTSGREHVGSPVRGQATQPPGPLPGTLSQHMQQQQQRAAIISSSGAEVLPPSLSVRAPTARAAAAAVWEAELASSPRPQQMLVPEEHAHYYLNNASGEAFGRVPASTGQLSGDLAALLRDLGLASLELIAGGAALGASGSQRLAGNSGSSGAGAAAAVIGMGMHQAAAAEKVPVVLSEAAAAPAAATAGGLLRYSRGDGVLTGQQDVDRGLEAGLSMAAVSRVFTAAGCVSDRGKGVTVRPEVLAEQLKGNMCFRDHLRAAAAADTGGAS